MESVGGEKCGLSSLDPRVLIFGSKGQIAMRNTIRKVSSKEGKYQRLSGVKPALLNKLLNRNVI